MKLLYFAWLRSRVGLGEEEIELPAEVRTVGDLMAWLRKRGPNYASAFGEASLIRAAIDLDFAGPEKQIGSAREIAFFPPITGGACR